MIRNSDADSLQRRVALFFLRLLILGAIGIGMWIGWENFIPLLFVLLLVYGIARSERGSTRRDYGWKKQK